MKCPRCQATVPLSMEDRLSSDLHARELVAAERDRGDRLAFQVVDLREENSLLEARIASLLRQNRELKKQAKPEHPYIHRVNRRTA